MWDLCGMTSSWRPRIKPTLSEAPCHLQLDHWYHWYESTMSSISPANFALSGHVCISLAATGLLYWDYQRKCERQFVFRCRGLGLAGKICFHSLSDQNRWAEVFSLSFPLLWVNTCLQVNVERT